MRTEDRRWLATKAWVVRKVVETLSATYRLQSAVGSDRLHALREAEQPAILCLWHNRIIYCAHHLRTELHFKGYALKMMISRSRDGELMSRVMWAWGGETARGSSNRGGGQAIRELVRSLRSGPIAVVTTPDGPRGPVYQAQAGTIVVAQLSGAPIYPMSYSAERAWRLRSWDRFMIPKPFSRVSVVVGEPIRVPRQLDEAGREEARAALEAALLAVDQEAEAVFS